MAMGDANNSIGRNPLNDRAKELEASQEIQMASQNTLLPKERSEILEELTSDSQGTGLEVQREPSPEGAIRAPFDPSTIDVITQVRTVDLLLARLREGELDLSPDFQRRANIWDENRKSSLIESMLLRIPIPSLYVSEDKDGNYTVVDGLQRLCAIAHFVDTTALNKAVKAKLNPLRLTGLQSFDFKNKSFAELPRPLQRRINETELTLHVIRASTPGDVKFNIFSRINQGGLPLTAQEIRNAVFAGDWRKKVRELAESTAFAKATEHKINGERMQDMELVLRFIAHYTFQKDRPDDQNLDEFLNETVEKRAPQWGDQYWENIEAAFYGALEAACRIFGKYAFRKYYLGWGRSPINRGLFETETVVLSRYTSHQIDTLAARHKQVYEKFLKLFADRDGDLNRALLYATGRGSSTNKRTKIIQSALGEVLNA
jgi:succinate dehydrogenase flavin-adding protein (antitoxin of CptAB toxin-antitoxin module)